MDFDFKKMSQEELITYVVGFDGMSLQGLGAEEFSWSTMNLSVDELVENLTLGNDKNDWIVWIETERIGRNSDWGYDSIQQISDYWLNNPEHEPIILARTEEGKIEIWDGFHRFGISILNKLENIPVIIGERLN